MGVAILILAVFHINYHESEGILAHLAHTGEIGVEFFILLSAIGMSFSLHKNPDAKTFYCKRLIRILPAYTIVGLAYEILCFKSLSIALPRFFLISAFWGDRCWWFVSFILLCYLLSPLLYPKALSTRNLLLYTILSLGSIALALILPQQGIMLYRFPTFLLGLILGRMILDHKELNAQFTLTLCCITIIILVWLLTHITPEPYIWICYLLITLPFCLLVAKLFDVCHQAVTRCFAFVGSISFEFYLLHVYFVLKSIHKNWGNGFWQDTASIPITILLAYFLHILLERLILKVKSLIKQPQQYIN